MSHDVDNSSLAARTARGGVIGLGTEIAESVLRFASIALLARLLTPEHFGLIAMVTAITTVAERFKDLGLSMATIQAQTLSDREASSLFWINAGFGAAIALLIALMSGPIADFYAEPRLVAITAILACGFLFGGLSVQHQALMRRHMMFGRLAAVQLGASVLSVLIAIGLAWSGWGYWALVVREVARAVLVALGSWIALRWRPLAPLQGADVRQHLRFGGNIAAFNLLWFFVFSLDQMVIGRLFGAEALGIYRVGVVLILGPIYHLIGPINAVAESALSRLLQQREEYARYYERIVAAFVMLSLPVIAVVAVFADQIILVVMGERWLPASDFVRIFAIVAFLRPAASTVGFVMTTQGRSGRYLAWGTLSAAALAACVLLGSYWGPQGVAYGHVAATYVAGLPLLLFGFRGSPVGLDNFLKALWRPLTAALLACAGLFIVRDHMLVHWSALTQLVLGTLLGLALFALILLLLPGGRSIATALVRSLRAAAIRRAT